MTDKDREKLRPIAAKARDQILRDFKDDKNVLGGGFGVRRRKGKETDTPAVVIYVEQKLESPDVASTARLPNELRVDGTLIDVDVVQTGPIRTLAYEGRVRPARWGCSIRHDLHHGGGTLGAVGLYRPNGRLGILSNNHVIARGTGRPNNTEEPGSPRKFDPIVQPSKGGTAALDTIAWLECWVPLRFQGEGENRVDAALAYEDPPGHLVNAAMGDHPIASPSTPGVGLLFGGSIGGRTFHNRMTEVLALLPFSFLPTSSGSMVAHAYVGQWVQKTGATSEYNTGRVLETDVTVTIGGYVPPERIGTYSATFTGQIATTPMGLPGDSGSVLLAGGDASGAIEPIADVPVHTTCGTVLAVDLALGIPLRQDDPLLREARDRYLRQTMVGDYLVDLFYKNEEALRSRVATTEFSEADRKLAQALYTKHVGDLKAVLLNPASADKLSDESLVDLAVATREMAKYQSAEEQLAAAAMLDIARSAQGKTFQEVMAMLNDEALLRRVRTILSGVRSIDVD